MPATKIPRPSSSLRDEVERLSSLFIESGFDMKSVFCPQNSQSPPSVNTHEELSDSNKVHSLEGDPKHTSKPENTVLLNATMEMTLSDRTEIVTVESKVRKKGRPSRAKPKRSKQQTSGSDKAENPVKNLAHSRKSHAEKTDPEDPTLKVRIPEDVLQSPQSQSLNVQNSHLSRKNRKRSKAKLKSNHAEQDAEVCDVSLNLDDYFTDPDANVSNVCKSRTSERDGAEQVQKSKITCRRSRAKGERASVSRKTFVIGPFMLGEHESQSKTVEKDDASEPDGLWNSESRRQTFIIWDHSSPNAASPAVGLMERDGRIVTAAQDPSVRQITSFSSSDACPTQSSCEGSSQANEDFGLPSVHPNPKKPSKNEKKRLSKKAARQNRQRTCEEKKEKEGSFLGNEKSRCSVNADFVVDNSNDAQKEGEVVGGGSLSARGEEAGSFEQFYGMDLDTLKLRIASEPRNLRNTFVIHQRDEPLNSRQSVTCDATSHMMNTRDELENFGDMLVDERPPWLATDAPLADADAGSPFSTPRRETKHRAVLNLSAAVASEATPGGCCLGIYIRQLWFPRTDHLLNYSCNFALKPAEY